MDISKIIFTQNILKVFSNLQENFEEKKNIIENDVKKKIGNLSLNSFYGIIVLFIVITLFLPCFYMFYPNLIK